MFTRALRPMVSRKLLRSVLVGVALVLAALSIATVAFLLHMNLSTVGSLELFLALLAALRLGFAQATVVSVTAFFCLNFLFTAPVFTLTVSDPQNWVSLCTFEAIALLVSGLSAKVRLHAFQAGQQQQRAVKLYELSRAVLLMEPSRPVSVQLGTIVAAILDVQGVGVWITGEHEDLANDGLMSMDDRLAREACRHGFDRDDPAARSSQRLLRLGGRVLGAITLRNWSVDVLAADAVASIAAVAYERFRAVERESRASLERDAERLRTAVLDSLAHGFKTPLTAIQTASSGLLALNHLNATQTELASIIDERATMLTQLTTRLLQTATLEAREVRMQPTRVSLFDMLKRVVCKQGEEMAARTRIEAPHAPYEDDVDVPTMELALEQLLDNAAKYSAQQSPIVLSVVRDADETRIVVENESLEGFSIGPEERGRIFERFYRGARAGHGPAGTGLGLSIVKKIAQAHGGRAWVDCMDRTTRFSLAIPHRASQAHKKEQYG